MNHLKIRDAKNFILSLAITLVSLATSPCSANLSIERFDDQLHFVKLRDIVPAAPIRGYEKYIRAKSASMAVYESDLSLFALPFAANQSTSHTENLFPIFRIDTRFAQTIYIGFALELRDYEIDMQMIEFTGTHTAHDLTKSTRDRIARLQKHWQNRVTGQTAKDLMVTVAEEWGRLPPYDLTQSEKSHYLAVSLYRFNLGVFKLRDANDALQGLERMLVEQGCTGALTVFESPRDSVR